MSGTEMTMSKGTNERGMRVISCIFMKHLAVFLTSTVTVAARADVWDGQSWETNPTKNKFPMESPTVECLTGRK